MFRYLLIATLLSFSVQGLILAQHHNHLTKDELTPCGYTGKSSWLEAYQRGEIAAVRSNDTIVVPLRLHIIGRDNGTGFLAASRVLDNLQQVNEDYAASNIVFYINGEINYIADTEFDNHDFGVGLEKMLEYNEPDVLNSYFATTAAGACGYYSPQGDAIVMADVCTGNNDRTWSHELGHFFSLPHTFFGWEFGETTVPTSEPAPDNVFGIAVEKTNGSNCSIAGDGFCDTPPDYLPFRWTCNSEGKYNNSLLDPDGVSFEVYGWPIMSYATDACMLGFSDEQTTAMQTNIFARGNLNDNIPIEYDAADASQMALVFPEDSATIQIVDSGGLTLEWTDVDHADFYLVELSGNAFFAGAQNYIVYGENTLNIPSEDPYIQAPQQYFWRVRPVNRFNATGSYTEVHYFRIADIVSSANNFASLAAELQLFPNPVPNNSQQVRIVANSVKVNGQVKIELLDLNGRKLLQEKGFARKNQQFAHTIELTGLAQGVYIIRLRQGDSIATKRLVVQ